MSLYRQFSQVEEKIANLLYCQSLCYLCLLESQRLTQVNNMIHVHIFEINQCHCQVKKKYGSREKIQAPLQSTFVNSL